MSVKSENHRPRGGNEDRVILASCEHAIVGESGLVALKLTCDDRSIILDLLDSDIANLMNTLLAIKEGRRIATQCARPLEEFFYREVYVPRHTPEPTQVQLKRAAKAAMAVGGKVRLDNGVIIETTPAREDVSNDGIRL